MQPADPLLWVIHDNEIRFYRSSAVVFRITDRATCRQFFLQLATTHQSTICGERFTGRRLAALAVDVAKLHLLLVEKGLK